jgi:hypothetical protein
MVGMLLFIGCTVIPLAHLSSDTFQYDCDLSYRRAVEAQQSMISYLAEKDMYAADKFSLNMPLSFAVLDKRFGYIPDSLPVFASRPVSAETEYAVMAVPGTPLDNPENLPLKLIEEIHYGDMTMSVYRILPDTIYMVQPVK